MNNFGTIKEEAIEILKKNPEEFKHANDALHWLNAIKPDSDDVQQISALGHDIERAVHAKNEQKYSSHKEFKLAHSKRSAEILKNILLKHGASGIEIQRMQNMVLNHEFGGNAESDLVRDADSLANFQWADDSFETIDTESLRGTMRRMFERMGAGNKRFISQIIFKHEEVRQMMHSLLNRGVLE